MKKSALVKLIEGVVKRKLNESSLGKIPIGNGIISLYVDSGGLFINFHTGPNQSGSYTQFEIPKKDIGPLITKLTELQSEII